TRIRRVHQITDQRCGRQQPFEKLNAFRRHLCRHQAHTCDVSARTVKTCHQSDPVRIESSREDYWDRLSGSFGSKGCWRSAGGKENGYAQLDELGGQRRQPVVVPFCPAKGDERVLAFDKPCFAKPLPKRRDNAGRLPGRSTAKKSNDRRR